MIVGLAVSVAAVLVLLWLSLMFVWWQKETGKKDLLATAAALLVADRGVRLVRRGWYALSMQLRTLGAWGTEKVRAAFLSLFPSAAPAFAKRDSSLGLAEGPTSYFLRSISETEKPASKKETKKLS